MHRDHNEDAFTILEDAHLFVVADGMGRHAAGEVAAKIYVDTLRDVFAATRPSRRATRRCRGARRRSATPS